MILNTKFHTILPKRWTTGHNGITIKSTNTFISQTNKNGLETNIKDYNKKVTCSQRDNNYNNNKETTTADLCKSKQQSYQMFISR